MQIACLYLTKHGRDPRTLVGEENLTIQPSDKAECILVVNTGATGDFHMKSYPKMQRVVDILRTFGHTVANAGPVAHKLDADQSYHDLPFKDIVQLIHSNCKAAITNDCLWAHVAGSLLNLPTFILYGPTSSHKNMPWGHNVFVIDDPGCQEHPCTYKSIYRRCQKRVCWSQEPEAVVDYFLDTIGTTEE
jgi:ADP-heptose:LPS heptosyltransferase